ncbi:glycoside hydrolase family 3 protein [Balneolales bacterium ANBcel1]|nr:glycoside hydrolase family 3 protein [Balneolales bacterium ANBcel1]
MSPTPSSPVPDVADLTQDQRIGQMLMVGFRGTVIPGAETGAEKSSSATDAAAPTQANAPSAPSEHPGFTDDADPGRRPGSTHQAASADSTNPVRVILRDIREYHLGGVILFDYDVQSGTTGRNIRSPRQLSELTAGLSAEAAIPLFIAIDQEGGTVNRLRPEYGFPETLSHRELGTQNDPSLTRSHAAEIAEVLRQHGCNLNFAPCVDLALNKENKAIYGRNRCFSDDPEIVARHAEAYVRGHREAGVGAVLKHFPGHGSSRDDTHLGLTDVTDTWQAAELIPYRRLLQNGQCDMVMTTHVFHRGLDPDHPATLSPAILQGMLRDELGFDGVIVSDDLQMKAISDHYGEEEVIRRALQAGVDILLFGNNMVYDEQVAARFFGVVREMLDRGHISEAQIDRSAARILRLKRQLTETRVADMV